MDTPAGYGVIDTLPRSATPIPATPTGPGGRLTHMEAEYERLRTLTAVLLIRRRRAGDYCRRAVAYGAAIREEVVEAAAAGPTPTRTHLIEALDTRVLWNAGTQIPTGGELSVTEGPAAVEIMHDPELGGCVMPTPQSAPPPSRPHLASTHGGGWGWMLKRRIWLRQHVW